MTHETDNRTGPGAHKSIPELFSDLTHHLTTLFKKEAELVKAEAAEMIDLVSKGVGELAAGTIFLLAALLVLLQALIAALSELVHPGWASLAVGVVVAIIGVIMLQKGKKDVRSVTPTRSIRQVEKDVHVAKRGTM